MSTKTPASSHIHDVPVHDLAAAWNQYAVDQGLVDPKTELLAVPIIDRNNNPAWRPAFRVPSTRTLVVIHQEAAHPSFEAARQSLSTMLLGWVAVGSISLQEIAA